MEKGTPTVKEIAVLYLIITTVSNFQVIDSEAVRSQESNAFYPPGVKSGYYKQIREKSGSGNDDRFGVLKREWFEGKDILDIGSNVGLFILTVARNFGPKSVRGVDISSKFIEEANLNSVVYQEEEAKSTCTQLPKNITFEVENYVLASDDLLETVKREYDMITCMSAVMWVQIESGDEGLKRLFKRVYLNLRPGGMFLLEYHPFTTPNTETAKVMSYKPGLEKKLKGLKFDPKDYKQYLLDLGFAEVEPINYKSLFKNTGRNGRPILLFIKSA